MLNEEELDWETPSDGEIGRAVKGHTFQAVSMSVIMTSERGKITLKWDRWIKV